MIDFLADAYRSAYLAVIGVIAIAALLLEWAVIRWERAQ